MRARSNWLVVSMVVGALAGGGLGLGAQAQDRPTADTIVAGIQAFYDQAPSLRAHFQQQLYTKIHDHTKVAEGEVIFAKPGKMRFTYADGAVTVSDGRRVIMFQPGDTPTDSGQYLERQLGDTDLAAPLSFLMGTGRIADQFTARLLDARAWRFDGQILELRPRTPSPHFERIVFYVRPVDTAGTTTYLVRAICIFDHQGNRNRIGFTYAPGYSTPVPASEFAWRPPASARRITP